MGVRHLGGASSPARAIPFRRRRRTIHRRPPPVVAVAAGEGVGGLPLDDVRRHGGAWGSGEGEEASARCRRRRPSSVVVPLAGVRLVASDTNRGPCLVAFPPPPPSSSSSSSSSSVRCKSVPLRMIGKVVREGDGIAVIDANGTDGVALRRIEEEEEEEEEECDDDGSGGEQRRTRQWGCRGWRGRRRMR